MRAAMHLDLLQSISLCGDLAIPNDDRAGAGSRRAWVIDGATDLGPPGLLGERGGAAWLAAAADAAFGAADASGLAGTCAQVFSGVEARFAVERQRAAHGAWELPCASYAAVQLAQDVMEVAWAGDCSVLHRRGETVAWLTPAPDRASESAAAAALGEGVGARKLRDPAVLADRRASRERSVGRVLGVEAAQSAAALRQAQASVVAGDAVLLMSDGFAALVDAYRAYDAAGLFAAVERDGLAALATQLRTIEAADAACTRFPRFKASDDATALWVRIAG